MAESWNAFASGLWQGVLKRVVSYSTQGYQMNCFYFSHALSFVWERILHFTKSLIMLSQIIYESENSSNSK